MMRLNASRSHRARVRPQPRREVLVLVAWPRWFEVLASEVLRETRWYWRSYKAYLKSWVWKNKRARAQWRAGYRCQICNSEKKLETHHRKYPAVWGTEPDNDLAVLCKECHERHHKEK